MTKSRLLVLITLAAAIVAFFAFDLGRFFTLDYFKSQHATISAYYEAHRVKTAAIFFLVYIAVTGLSLPGAAIMTLVAGAIFGLLWGTVIVSFASSIGATLAFLASRFLFRDAIQKKFGDKLAAFNRGFEKEGAFYLFALRLVPAFPFFVINLVMGLTPIKTRTFYWVSQLGMLLGTVVYVNAGTQLARIDSLKGILSPGLLLSFVLLGIFPLIAKKIVDTVKARKVYAKWTKPARFDRNLVVIGAGSAGLVSAYIAAAVKAKVTLIEKHRMGGDCLNTGCVPSKALIRSAKFLSHVQRAKEFGMNAASVDFSFAQVMERVQRVIRDVEPHDSVERYNRLGVECIEGEATITSPWIVEVKKTDGSMQTISTRGDRDRRRRATVRAADPGHRGGRLRHLRHGLEPARAAEAYGRARWRANRLRAHPVLRASRFESDAGRDASANHDPGGSRDLGNGDEALPSRRHRRACQPQGTAVRHREWPEDPRCRE